MRSNLIFYNCSGAEAFVTLNGTGAPTWRIKITGPTYGYYPFTQNAPRDLSKEHGGPGNWGQNNKLRIAWDLIDPLDFKNIQDPSHAIGDVDLLLWIFSDRVEFSQGAIWLVEVLPS
jgi:hypothetical protein